MQVVGAVAAPGTGVVGVVGAGALLVATAALLVVLLLARRAHQAYKGYLHMKKCVAGMPGPPTLPIVGNLLEVVAGGDDHIYDNLVHMMARYGPTVRVWLGPELVIALTDARDAEFLTTSQDLVDKSPFYAVLEPLLGLGLSCLGGQEVRRHRKIVMPSLHLDILHDFVDTFRLEALRFADRLEQHADDGEVFDIAPLCIEYSLAAALETIMSTELDEACEEGRRKFGVWLEHAMGLFMFRVWRPWYLSDTLFRLSGRREHYLRTMTALNGFTETVIAAKRRQLAAREPTVEAPRSRPRRRAFLDNILDSEEGAALTDLELRDEVKTLLCTGAETSASTLSFVLMVLSLRQDVQDKMIEELDDVFGGDASRPVTMAELPHLQYVERVIKETLRLFPVLPFFARSCPRDVELPSGFTAPRGAHLALFLPALHNDPRTWPNPRNFDPDRFLAERSRGRHPFSYLPFSAGPRNCVGQRYAMLLLKVELATLLRRFRVLPPGDEPHRDVADVPMKVTLVIAVKGGVRIRVQRRHRDPA